MLLIQEYVPLRLQLIVNRSNTIFHRFTLGSEQNNFKLLNSILCSSSSPRVETLLKGLSPAYLRLGGTSADYVVYSNEPVEVFENSGVSPPLHTYTSEYTIHYFIYVSQSNSVQPVKVFEKSRVSPTLYTYTSEHIDQISPPFCVNLSLGRHLKPGNKKSLCKVP